ncbi:S8 family peptidase [Saccharopolyspora taberi]|uniref:S8 family serine peptidase n=1 Tax=Saccharopolyspora taberi TaxID=60895 RepID=A0ABN3V2Y4_9PSEU
MGVARLRRLCLVIVLAVLAALLGPVAAGEPSCTGSGPNLRYVVLFAPETSGADAGAETSDRCGTLAAYYQPIGVGVVDSADPRFAQLIGGERAYSAEGAVREDGGASGFGGELAADPQWNAEAVRAPEARAVTRGSPDVVVGVLDSAVDHEHPELAAAFDPARSADCLTPEQPAWTPRTRGAAHGTHVAGIIAAADDGLGSTGIAPGVRVASVRVVDEEGYVHPEYAVCGFMWAADHGIRVVNSSFLVESAQQGCTGSGSPVPREALRRAVGHATGEGVLTVAAAGNDQLDLAAGRRPNCATVPAGLEDVIGVSAVSPDQVKAGYSSYGLGVVDVAAPGGDVRTGCVLSTVPGGGYDTACGTSMAAPHASGVAALLASRHPSAGPRELAELLAQQAKPLGCPADYDLNADTSQDALCRGFATYNGFYGHGLVDAYRAATG